MTRHLLLGGQRPLPTLDPPATDEELSWWEQAQKPYVRNALLKMLAITSTAIIGPQLVFLEHPARLLIHDRWLLDAALLALAPTLGYRQMWQAQKGAIFERLIRAKRFRDALVEETPAPMSPPQSLPPVEATG